MGVLVGEVWLLGGVAVCCGGVRVGLGVVDLGCCWWCPLKVEGALGEEWGWCGGGGVAGALLFLVAGWFVLKNTSTREIKVFGLGAQRSGGVSACWAYRVAREAVSRAYGSVWSYTMLADAWVG